MKIKIMILLIVILLFAIFVFQNTHLINIDFLIWSVSMSAIVLISLVMLIGVVAGFIIAKLFDRPSKTGMKDTDLKQTSN